MNITRTHLVLRPDSSRVLFRPFRFGDIHRMERIIARVIAMSPDQVRTKLDEVYGEFVDRHLNLRDFFLRRYEDVREHLLTDNPVEPERQELIGAYFTQEYSLESAALFNPSMIWHPDQSGLADGDRRFIISLRATGEGHISSISFRAGIAHADGSLSITDPTPYVTAPRTVPNAAYDRDMFRRKLFELGVSGDFIPLVMQQLEEQFTLHQLEIAVNTARGIARQQARNMEHSAATIIALARSNYTVTFRPEQPVSERTLFPASPAETNGIEDARFVEFTQDDGTHCYYATYTAYDGRVILPQLLHTTDFLTFSISTLNGPEVANKGMALFPRRVNGHYAMISRQDGENIFLMYSDNIHFWYEKQMIARPTYPWEYVQLGNCGSPIETDEGWLLLTHGVGPMRKYAMGAYLLDLDDPSRIIGRLEEPLLTPNANEREGYVPNVVYSCGAQVHAGNLIIPYAMADYASTFATVPVHEVLDAMKRE